MSYGLDRLHDRERFIIIVNLMPISICTVTIIPLFESTLFEDFLYWFCCYEFLRKEVASIENKQQAMGETDCMTEREP